MKFYTPLSGPTTQLEDLPDEVFASKMLGDGIAIDPTEGLLVAPCDGKIAQYHPAGHALTLRTEDGLGVLMHIGIDTVELKGKGFEGLVKVGDQVVKGQPLIRFDIDFLAQNARSLLTPILLVEPKEAELQICASGKVMAGKDELFRVDSVTKTENTQTQQGPKSQSKLFQVMDPTGLHARPAAIIANTAKQFQAEISIHRGTHQANAKSIIGIMAMEIAGNDKIYFTSQGPEGDKALKTLEKNCKGVFSESAKSAPAPSKPVSNTKKEIPQQMEGLSLSPGLAVGQVLQLKKQAFEIEKNADPSSDEWPTLKSSLQRAQQQLDELQTKLAATVDASKAAIFTAQKEVLDDPELLSQVRQFVNEGRSAAWSWREVMNSQIEFFKGMKSELIAARATDFLDVRDRVLRILMGKEPDGLQAYDKTIVVGQNLTPSDTASMDREKILGLCSIEGGATSHMAILARDFGVPALSGLPQEILDVPNGTTILLDAETGTIELNPNSALIEKANASRTAQQEQYKIDLSHAHDHAMTKDEHRVEVFANLAQLSGTEKAVELGAEGVGLLRSEFLFLERTTAPSEAEQTQVYKQMAQKLKGRPLTIRTLDVGGDKELPYLDLPKEENPFLGIRGIRLSLKHPESFRTQLRAILKAHQSESDVRIMFPMVSSIEELREAKEILEQERQSLKVEKKPQVGIMIEVPAAALNARQLAQEVDFFSVGTNDLTQYTLAMDRGHPELAKQMNSLDPAILRLIHFTVEAAHANGKYVAVCGGMASDPKAVPYLVGLGVDELSVSVPAIPKVKACVRELNYSECQSQVAKLLEKTYEAEESQ